MRTFIALEISAEIQSELARLISHLKTSGADVKWVRPEIVHLTLKFLGEIGEDRIGQIGSELDDISASIKPFELSIKEVGAFPKIEHPRVIWVGLDKGADETKHLAAVVDEAMSRLGFPRESRPFEGHLTIGRVRSSKNIDKLKDKISSSILQIKPCSCNISSVILFQSTLTPHGSIYTKLHESKLQ